MKHLLAAAVLASLCLPAQANNGAVNGAIIGGIAGAVIGNNSGNGNGLQGALIGAGAGALIGSAVDHNRRHSEPQVPYRHGYRPHGVIVGGGWHGHRHHGHGGVIIAPTPVFHPGYYRPVYHRPVVVTRPAYVYRRPSYASTGLFWGGITGAIIGHNSHRHNAWRGAAIGAGAGLVLGSILDSSAEREVAYEQAYTPEPAPAPAPTTAAPQNVTIINNYYNAPASSMSSANSMFGR